jgi:uncharacterized protein DUF3606
MSAVIEWDVARREFRRMQDGNLSYLSNRYCKPHEVSVLDATAIAYWCRHFNTTSEQLISAVKAVGTNPAIVQLQLRRR